MSPTSRGRSSGREVERTGLALVHAGEVIVPAPGSEAELDSADAAHLELCFPVEVEIREVSTASESLIAEVLQRLSRAIG
jgi:hypothetical protein